MWRIISCVRVAFSLYIVQDYCVNIWTRGREKKSISLHIITHERSIECNVFFSCIMHHKRLHLLYNLRSTCNHITQRTKSMGWNLLNKFICCAQFIHKYNNNLIKRIRIREKKKHHRATEWNIRRPNVPKLKAHNERPNEKDTKHEDRKKRRTQRHQGKKRVVWISANAPA